MLGLACVNLLLGVISEIVEMVPLIQPDVTVEVFFTFLHTAKKAGNLETGLMVTQSLSVAVSMLLTECRHSAIQCYWECHVPYLLD